MALIDDITAVLGGADFKRADLHIHSFGLHGSYDVTDINMTPQNIIDLAIKENLNLISITDHNSIGNVKSALAYSDGKPILVVPGVELSTSEGHLLLYFPEIQPLEDFVGKLNFSPDRKQCLHTIQQCLDMATKYDGIGIAAHIDKPGGFESLSPGYNPFKEIMLKCKNILGLEIASADNKDWYSDRDSDLDRRKLFTLRRDSLSEDNGYEIAKVLFSDAHTLDSLGRNALGNNKITRIKMDELSFKALKIALIDSTARIRMEDLIPPQIPHFVGIKFDGGFLDGEIIKFSRNLTCIIGGRGTGKSTMLESLRCVTNNTAKDSLVDCEVWPDKISLVWQDETGQQHYLERVKLQKVINTLEPEDGITFIPIESYGQGETAETIQHCDKDPNVLLNFLDGFADFGALKIEDEQIRQQLLDNQTVIEWLTLDVNTIPDVKRALSHANSQLATLKSQNAKEIVELEEGIAKEKSFRQNLVDQLNRLIKGINSSFEDKTLVKLVLGLDDSSLIVGKNEFSKVKIIVENYSQTIDTTASNIKDESNKVVQLIKDQVAHWNQKEQDTIAKIETIRKSLEAQSIKLDMGFIRKITRDASELSSKLAELEGKKKQLDEVWKERRSLLKKRLETKSKIYGIRHALAYELTNNLHSTVIDYHVTIKFRENVFSKECQQILQNALNLRTSQVPRAEIIATNVSVPSLLKAVHAKDSSILSNLIDNKGAKLFSTSDAKQAIEALSEPRHIFTLERCQFEDRPEITITKFVEGRKPIIRDFSKLSLGQQQSILLSVLLFSKSNKPLIIDQPEDNLDSEFIYRTLVRNLRRVKEHRQVIVVTHNANIAVLGDAELIIPLRATNEKSYIIDRGSIDTVATKKMACQILEGSEQAFLKRKQIYNID